MRKLLPGFAVVLMTGCSLFMSIPAPVHSADGIWVDARDMTLYTFDKDPKGKSACTGPCAVNWPPLLAAPDAKPSGDWSIVVRDNGQGQWAYKGKPLYTWTKDTRPGERTGDGVNNLWRTARP